MQDRVRGLKLIFLCTPALSLWMVSNWEPMVGGSGSGCGPRGVDERGSRENEAPWVGSIRQMRSSTVTGASDRTSRRGTSSSSSEGCGEGVAAPVVDAALGVVSASGDDAVGPGVDACLGMVSASGGDAVDPGDDACLGVV